MKSFSTSFFGLVLFSGAVMTPLAYGSGYDQGLCKANPDEATDLSEEFSLSDSEVDFAVSESFSEQDFAVPRIKPHCLLIMAQNNLKLASYYSYDLHTCSLMALESLKYFQQVTEQTGSELITAAVRASIEEAFERARLEPESEIALDAEKVMKKIRPALQSVKPAKKSREREYRRRIKKLERINQRLNLMVEPTQSGCCKGPSRWWC